MCLCFINLTPGLGLAGVAKGKGDLNFHLLSVLLCANQVGVAPDPQTQTRSIDARNVTNINMRFNQGGCLVF